MSLRIFGFLRRFLSGEDVILVRQTKEQWEQQFAEGAWNRLQEGQPNTIELARLIRDCANAKNRRIRVLDVGCGNGGLARLIADTVDYTGIDISASAVASARKLAPQGTFIAGDAMNPDTHLGVFDVIVFSELLYYLDPRIIVPRYRVHMNPGASIYISVVRFWRSWFIWRRIRSVLHIEHPISVRHPISWQYWDIATGRFA